MKNTSLKYPRLIYLQRPFLLTCFSLLFIFVFTFAVGDSTANDLRKILPVDSTLARVSDLFTGNTNSCE